MDELELWTRGLLTEAIGPEAEWKPSPPAEHQQIHDSFWKLAAGIIPDNEDDEQFWMTHDATRRLKANG